MAEEGRHGLAALVRFHGFLEVGNGLGHGRGGHRDDGVGGHAGLLHFQRPGADHAHDAGLGGGVVGLAEVSALPGGRADGDDPAGDAVLLEVGECFPDAREGAAEVDVDDGVEVLVGHFQQALVPQDAGIGDQDVQAAELRDGCLHQLFGNLGASDRSDDGGGLPAVGLDGPDCFRSHLGVDVVDDDGGTLAGEFPGVGEAQAPTASGDDCYFA